VPYEAFNETTVEQAALAWLAGLGYAIASGPAIAPGEPAAERDSFDQVILPTRLRAALARLNPHASPDTLEEAFRRITRLDGPDPVTRNRTFHTLLTDGLTIEQKRPDGRIAGVIIRLVDFDDPAANDHLAVNQFTVTAGGAGSVNRRADIVLFLNGLPLVVLELKNAANHQADIHKAFHQLQTYKAQIPRLFTYNQALVISDGSIARIGTLTADRERFMPWRTIQGEALAPAGMSELEVLLTGVFEKRRFLGLLRHFIVFEADDHGRVIKKMAGYHQFHAVNRAVAETVKAAGVGGDRRVGVVWHTQGSGKSLTMAFYAGRVIADPAMQNPTIVVLTDRNDLDQQLCGTFGRCKDLLRQPPEQASDRADLRARLNRASGGVIFTTIQKFLPEQRGDQHPCLSDRRNIVVIADEAHRSQYDFIDGFARHMRDALPHASFIGFTGTPIETTDKNTQAVFGDYISVYDIQRAVQDGATVPIYYESRLAKLALKADEKPTLDADFETATEGEEVARKEKLKSKWAQLEALVGAEKRLKRVAADIVAHWERRLEDGMEGKAMIVAMSRRICVELYNEIIRLRPHWHDDSDEAGVVKVIMTGSASDPVHWQPHIRTKAARDQLATRFKDSRHPFKIVIVRDMWLTGFDAPCLHTMYLDKPMQGHGLMQAIARVNRVFRDKPGGLVVDYLGLAHELKQALATYTQSGGTGSATIDQEEAVAAMLAKHELCCQLLAPFDWSLWTTGRPEQRLSLLPGAQERILAEPGKREKFILAVKELSAAFALAVPHEEAIRIRDDVGFFQAVRAALLKSGNGQGPDRPPEDIEHAIRQLVSRAVLSDEVVDIFAAAGLRKPNIGVLSEEFLAEVRDMPQRNLAVELLRKLLSGEITTRSKRNLVQARSFAELLEQSITRYQNRAIEAAAVIEELIALAKDLREADRRGESLGLTPDEVAFYDALQVNDSAVKVLGEPTLQTIARELVASVRANTSIDWTIKESVRAKLRVVVKRILNRYGYPPDKREEATQTVLEQAALLLADAA
jgi:type I restriction enzyme R subunit